MLQEDLGDSKYIVRFEAMYATAYELVGRILLPSYLAARLNEEVCYVNFSIWDGTSMASI